MQWKSLLYEYVTELRDFFVGKSPVAQIIVPPILFAVVRVLVNMPLAIAAALVYAGGHVVYSAARGQQLRYALLGMSGVVIALASTVISQIDRFYYVPGMALYAGIALACIVTPFTRMPFVAWVSWSYRQWPKKWYQHPQVRAAYVETTWLWAVFFTARISLQLYIFTTQQFATVAIVDFLTGWPTTMLLLLITMLWGRWRLHVLGGPSVDEFRNNTPPPWNGQQHGY